MAGPIAIIMAPPTDCKTREATRLPTPVATPHSMEPRVNSAKPAM
jgi:hypothetical protein